jgi:hypothetical protein
MYIDNETFQELKNAIKDLVKKCEKLDIIDEIHESLKDINSSYKEILKDKKSDEHVKRENNESAVKGEDENAVKDIESNSGKYEQNEIAQRATITIKNFRCVKKIIKKPRVESSTSIAVSKVSTKIACEELSYSLQKDPTRAFRRRKKYKCDDGG